MTDIGKTVPDYSKEKNKKTGKHPTKKEYPSLRLSGESIPKGLADYEPGQKVRIEIVVNIAELSKRATKDYDGTKQRIELEVMKLGVIGKAGKLTREEFLSMGESEQQEAMEQEVLG